MHHLRRRIMSRPKRLRQLGARRDKLPGRYLFFPIKGDVFLVLAAVFCRGAGAALLEKSVEVGHVVEAGTVRDLADIVIGVEQLMANVSNAQVDEEFRETGVRVFLKEMAESRGAHIDLCSNIPDFELLLVEIFENISVGNLDAVAIGPKRLGRKPFAG